MSDLIDRLNETFLPMAFGFLVSHPEIILVAYLLLKGRDALFDKLCKPQSMGKQTKVEQIPIIYDTSDGKESIAPSQDEIDDHFGRHT